MQLAYVVEEIDAPIEKVWAELSDFYGVQRLFPEGGVEGLAGVESVTFRGEGIGCVRTVHLTDGTSLDEILEEVDEGNYSFAYSQPDENPVGVKGYLARVKMTPVGPSKTRVDYYSEGTPGAELPIEQLQPICIAVYKALINGARKLTMATA